ncbi:zinc finger CDGSH type superfamily protein [Streptomyces sp. CNQ-509]|uniref:(4Fe-4S)-binding protein n=1 Tax=unclassified Streptomyces TaxID=2593676 RepID=UPI00062DEE46|nr:(4Fe-4S)-binding protein [Streptomyces sp. CNQ-509]AKH86393.1 zinc finger CDGSH type superfamily protein [Streptomyces sp. CNQ-509]
MSSKTQKRAYEGKSITVTFEAGRCLHAAECVRGLPEVFDPDARPWIRPDGAGAERLAEVVRRCPSGALQYDLVDGDAEAPDRPTHVARNSAGQVLVRGELSLDTAAGPRAETRAVLCGCGQSAHQPYCDHGGPCGRTATD